MARARGKFRLYAPSLVTLLVLLPFFAYYVRQVRAQEGYLNAHAFRVLEVAASQFAFQVQGARDTMFAAIQVREEWDLREPLLRLTPEEKQKLKVDNSLFAKAVKDQAELYLRTFLADLADIDPSYEEDVLNKEGVLNLVEGDTVTLVGHEGISPAKIKLEVRRVVDSEGKKIGAKDPAKPAQPRSFLLQAFLDPARMLNRAAGAVRAGVFETVMVATSDGAVIAQTDNSAATVRDVEALLAGRKTLRTVEAGTPDGGGGQKLATPPVSGEAVHIAPQFAGAEERVVVEVSGEAYFLFSIPLPLTVEITQSKKNEPLVLYGLARKEAWEARARQLPSLSVWAVLLTFIMGMTLLWPVIQLQTMSPKERLGKTTLALMAGSSILGAVLFAAIFLVSGFALRLDHEKRAQLKALSAKIQAHFAWETVQALQTSRLAIRHMATMGSHPLEKRFVLLSSLLEEPPKGVGNKLLQALLSYPYFVHIILSSNLNTKDSPNPRDEERQISKISAASVPTPLIPLPASKFPFVDRLRNGRPSTLHHTFGGGTEKEHSFAMQSFVSPNTGEFLPVLMFYPDDGMANIPGGMNKTDYRILLTTKMPSLVNVLLPRGFGFAVVDDEGRVLFHSDSSRNLRENLYSECDAPARLQKAVVTRSAETLSMLYGGRDVTMFVQPLAVGDVQPKMADHPGPTISNLNVSLIVFYESYAKTTLYSQLGRSFLIYAALGPALLLLLVLIGLRLRHTLSPSSRARYSSKRPWPSDTEKPFYLLEGLWGIAWFLVAFLAWICWPMDSRGWAPPLPVSSIVLLLLLFVALLAGVGGLFFSFRKHPRVKRVSDMPWLTTWKDRIPLSAAYSLRLFSWALAFMGPLFLIMFQVILWNLQAEEHRFDVGAAGTAMQARRERNIRGWRGSSATKVACRSGKAGECPAEEFRTARTDGVDYFDVYDPAAACPDVNRDGSQKNGVLAAGLCVPSSARPGGQVPRNASITENFNWRGLFFHILAFLFLALLFLWKHFLVRRLFILDFRPPEPLRPTEASTLSQEMQLALTSSSQVLRRTLIFADPRSGTGAAVAQIVGYLRQNGLVSPLFAPLDCPTLLGGRPEDDGGWRKKLVEKQASGHLAILDNFATGLINETDRKDKLALLEKVVFARKAHVYVLTSIDPLLVMQSLTSQRPSDCALRHEADRWARVLSSFDRRALVQQATAESPSDGPVAKLTSDLQKDSHFCEKNRAEFVGMVESELSATAFLRRRASEIKVERLSFSSPLDFEQSLVAEVRELADGYYRVVWLNTTGDERLALFQLAKDGWMNPLNKIGITHVIRKQLIVKTTHAAGGDRDGAWRLMNESFRQFVLEAVEEREAGEWAAAQNQSLWPSMRIALMLAVALLVLFMAYIRRDLFDVYFSYVAALAGGGAALVKLLLQFFSKDESKLASVLGGGPIDKGGEEKA